jgi:diadenosine tetraphosphate (Ap4A) HIT family hydrolase
MKNSSANDQSDDLHGECFFCHLPADFILGQKDGFLVTLCSGPLVEGHVLLTSIEHIPGLIDLPAEQLRKLVEAKRHVRSILEEAYGSCLFIEHGHHGHLRDEEHCSHAHMHILPIDVNLSKSLSERMYKEELADYEQSTYIPGEYMHVEDAKRASYFYRLEQAPERRFTRKIILQELNESERWANWEEFSRKEVIEATRLKLRRYF